MRAVLLARMIVAAFSLAAPAMAQPDGAMGSGRLSRMLQVVPAPASAQQLMRNDTVFAYAWLRPLPGISGHALDPVAGRYRDLKGSVPVAVESAGLRQQLPVTPTWPTVVGFDADAVDALLVAPMAGDLPAHPLQVLAGGPRLHDAARIGTVLEGRGFTREEQAGVPLFSIGEDNEISIKRRLAGDPFGGGLGYAQRIAVTPDGLLEASSTGAMRRALDARAGRTPSLAEVVSVRALLAGLPDAEVTQAVALSPLVNLALADPTGPKAYGPYTLPAEPPMPVWAMAALAELVSPPGVVRQRLVLAVMDPDAARAVLEVRLKVTQTGPQPVAVQAVAFRVLPERFGPLGVLVADLTVTPPRLVNNTPLYRWYYEASHGIPTPLTVRMAEPAQPDGKRP